MPSDQTLASLADQSLSIGMDMVALAEVAHSLAHFGDRYVSRVFSADERRHWPVGDGVSMTRSCALSFAVKEAALKALGLADAGVDWRDMLVHVQGRHAAGLSLRGRPAGLVAAGGGVRWHVTASVAAGFASAMVCAHRTITPDD